MPNDPLSIKERDMVRPRFADPLTGEPTVYRPMSNFEQTIEDMSAGDMMLLIIALNRKEKEDAPAKFFSKHLTLYP